MGLTHAEFVQLFDQWATTYDATVYQQDPADGFEEYEQVLERVADLAGAGPGVTLLDVGTGTGNLARVLRARKATVTAVEPSAEMRRVARAKLGDIAILDGQFLALPVADGAFDAIVSTYAFHHLTDVAKVSGAKEMLRALRPGGRIVLGDIAWADKAAREAMVARFVREGKWELVKEVEEEYYPTIGLLTSVFAALGCSVYVERLTEWVWALVAVKVSA